MFYIYIILGISLLGLIYMRFEATWVETRSVKLTKNKKYLKILQLSDIHISHLKVSYKKVKQAIEKENPDLIVISGDFIERVRHIPKFMNFLDAIKGSSPIYLCLGNHDYEAFIKAKKDVQSFMDQIEKKGVTILHNRSICYDKNSKKYNIIGIADLRKGYPDFEEAFRNCDKSAFANIGFSHNPDIALSVPPGKLDYLLCGHFHGGQIWMPFNLEFISLRSEELCKRGIKRGLHKLNGIHLYINRGLGNVLFPLRFFSRPEITVLYLP